MSAESLPITPARFAAALKDLPISSLHLKVLELRNSIAHLDYSNEQLRPFAEGTVTAVSTTSSSQPRQAQSQSEQPQSQQQQQQRGEPDQDCIDAIKENEEVIARMQERIRLVREEVESRGLSWTEFQAEAGEEENNNNNKEAAQEEDGEGGSSSAGSLVNGAVGGGADGMVNGTSTSTSAAGQEEEVDQGRRHSAWTDGTFQTGVIRDGELHVDAAAGSRRGQGQGGSLTDERLRRGMEELLRLAGDEDDEERGLHL
jgi:hypothetical protein